MDDELLPPLPEPAVRITVELAMVRGGRTKPNGFFTADQMRDYALAAVAESVLEPAQRFRIGPSPTGVGIYVDQPTQPAPSVKRAMTLLKEMNRYFTSGNLIPIEKAVIPASEWHELRAAVMDLVKVRDAACRVARWTTDVARRAQLDAREARKAMPKGEQ